jgi:hypothetical protein
MKKSELHKLYRELMYDEYKVSIPFSVKDSAIISKYVNEVGEENVEKVLRTFIDHKKWDSMKLKLRVIGQPVIVVLFGYRNTIVEMLSESNRRKNSVEYNGSKKHNTRTSDKELFQSF